MSCWRSSAVVVGNNGCTISEEEVLHAFQLDFGLCSQSREIKELFRGHVANVTRHGMPLPSHHGGTYLSTSILHAFELLGWRELGQAMGAHSCRVDSIL